MRRFLIALFIIAILAPSTHAASPQIHESLYKNFWRRFVESIRNYTPPANSSEEQKVVQPPLISPPTTTPPPVAPPAGTPNYNAPPQFEIPTTPESQVETNTSGSEVTFPPLNNQTSQTPPAPANTTANSPTAGNAGNNSSGSGVVMPPTPTMAADDTLVQKSANATINTTVSVKLNEPASSTRTPVSEVVSPFNNDSFIPGDGFNTVQFASNGKAGFIVWRNGSLVYRERTSAGGWTESVLANGAPAFTVNPEGVEYRFLIALLLYDSNSLGHVYRVSGNSIVHFVQSEDGLFSQAEQIKLPSNPDLLDAQFGPGNVLHIAFLNDSGQLRYGTSVNGGWRWENVAQVRGNPRLFLPQSFAPRYFSLAIDQRNRAHLVFTPELNLEIGPEGYTRPYSQLHYASNDRGSWRTQLVQDVPDKSGDAAYGASIAVGPEDKPFIVSWYNERAGTGSSQNSRLLWHAQDGRGNWNTTAIAQTPEGYVAGDGTRGTGFAPYLRFDSEHRPHIIFSDHASQHFDSGQNEYAGQIRHLWFNGREWNGKVIHSQNAPLQQQIIYPAFAVRNGELLITAVERSTNWENDYRRAHSSYRFLLYSTSY